MAPKQNKVIAKQPIPLSFLSCPFVRAKSGKGWARESGVIYHLQKVSEKSGCKVNGTRIFELFQLKISRSNGISKKLVLFFRTECSKRKFVFHFFKAIFDIRQVQAFAAVFR